MRCHICGEPAIGQCQTCWKFYCGAHGDVVCRDCAETRGRPPLSALFPGLPADADPDAQVAMLSAAGVRGSGLRGVLAIGQVKQTDRADVTLLSLESYGDGFIIPYRVASRSARPSDPADLFGALHPSVLFGPVRDDLGRDYRGGFGGSSGGGDSVRGEAMFTPAIADGATRLDVRIEEIQWASWTPSQRSSVEVGPWVLEVSLANMKAVSR